MPPPPSSKPLLQHRIALAERDFRGGRVAEAERLLRELVQRDPRAPHISRAYELLAYICGNRTERVECERFLQLATALPDASPEAFFYLGRVQLQLGRPREAIGSLEASMKRAGEFFEALHELGVAHAALADWPRALACYERAGRMNPRSVELLANVAASLVALHRPADALACYERILAIDANDPKAWASRAATLVELGRRGEALESYERALALRPGNEPDNDALHGDRLQMRMRLCRWDDWASLVQDLIARIGRGERAADPFALLATPAGAAVELACARGHAAATFAALRPMPFDVRGPREPDRRIRIGYFSNDFRNHATSHLMARMLAQHDRSRFECFAFSFSAERDDWSARVAGAVDHFFAVDSLNDEEVVAMARQAGIDIAVDLHGYTEGRRTGIFARRAAPVQVNYLGYPGTMGCDFIDYIVADATLIRPEDRVHYSEQVVTLAGCYQPNDDGKRIAEPPPERAGEGLPPRGFVFAAFNASHKITPDAFDVWMRLLRQVPGSVLWLQVASDEARAALVEAARARGVEPERLVFARALPLAEHLARLALADLFLDTFHYNAHTTCSDALWAGLPVLTLAGDTFASRVAASLLQTIGLPELVAPDVAAYESLALALAASPERLADLRRRLQAQRTHAPLFDTPRYTRQLETAYEAMWRRHEQGLAPTHIALPT